MTKQQQNIHDALICQVRKCHSCKKNIEIAWPRSVQPSTPCDVAATKIYKVSAVWK